MTTAATIDSDLPREDDGPSCHTASTKAMPDSDYDDYEPYCMPETNDSSSDYDNLPNSPESAYSDEPYQRKSSRSRQLEGSASGTTSRSKRVTPKADDQSFTLTVFCMLILLIEMAAAMLAVIYYEDLIECCGESFISDSASVTQKWNSAIFGIGIGYLVLIIIEIPVVALKQEPVFLFNPMIGFLLAVHMLYVTETYYSYVIYGLETVAMFGQSLVLIQMQRNSELCIHSLFNYTTCGLVIFLLIEMSRQGGYCIVDGQLQSVFMESTCNTGCTDDASCFVCTGNATSCFIRFPS